MNLKSKVRTYLFGRFKNDCRRAISASSWDLNCLSLGRDLIKPS